MNKYEELLKEYVECPGHPDKAKVELMKLIRLDRMAAALEGIEQSLSNIDQSLDALTDLSDCISMTNGGLSKIFCITGNVSTHEW